MKRYFVYLAYKGTPYHGWQIQKKGERSVQACLEYAFSCILRQPISIVGAGRTDTGVHALSYYAHFDYDTPEEDANWDKIIYKINGILDKEISVYDIFEVPLDFHARFSAIKRTYTYCIHMQRNPFLQDFSHFTPFSLDIKSMQLGAEILLGFHDFSCFSKSRTQTITNNCTIQRAEWRQEDNRLYFTITADRFLRNMVRAVVGTLIELGLGKRSVESMHDLLRSQSRSQAGSSVPAKALYLVEVVYPELEKYQRREKIEKCTLP